MPHQSSVGDVDWIAHDRYLQIMAARPDPLLKEDSEFLFSYFLTGWLQNRSADGAYARYPGARSRNGRQCDDLEGFSRILPLLCARLGNENDASVRTLTNEACNLPEQIANGLAAGVNGSSASYWGDMGDYDQRIVEASDVALALWLARDSVWRDLSQSTRESLVDWMSQVNDVRIPDNNWHLIVTFINLVLRVLGGRDVPASAERHYSRFKQFYLGSGWFADGPDGDVDFYNAWQIHYLLWWIGRIDQEFDREFIRSATNEFVDSYKFLISPFGVPILGRSTCYRIAAAAPLIASAVSDQPGVSVGLAHRAHDVLWKHYIRNGAVSEGRITQGYYGQDLRLLDNYSGPASCLLSLRSLVQAIDAGDPFWNSPHDPLLVEQSDFDIQIPDIRWRVLGDRTTGDVTIRIESNEPAREAGLQEYTLPRRILGTVLRRPLRPNNRIAKYEQFQYSAKHPFFE